MRNYKRAARRLADRAVRTASQTRDATAVYDLLGDELRSIGVSKKTAAGRVRKAASKCATVRMARADRIAAMKGLTLETGVYQIVEILYPAKIDLVRGGASPAEADQIVNSWGRLAAGTLRDCLTRAQAALHFG